MLILTKEWYEITIPNGRGKQPPKNEAKAENKLFSYEKKNRNRMKRENAKERKHTYTHKRNKNVRASSNNEGTNENIVLRTYLTTRN